MALWRHGHGHCEQRRGGWFARAGGGQRQGLAALLLSPANTFRLTDGLSHLRGAVLKLGQMLSMDTGIVLPGELTAILSRCAMMPATCHQNNCRL